MNDVIVDSRNSITYNGIVFVNVTPHPVTGLAEDGQTVLFTIPQATGEDGKPEPGRVVRLREMTVYTGEIGGFQISQTVFGDPDLNIPPAKDRVYITSLLHASAVVRVDPTRRDDVMIPNEVVRDRGTVKGCKSFGRV